MLVIRLARGGRTKYPVYRIVAAESSRAATGKFVEILGTYNPHTKEVSLNKEAIAKRLSHGAQPSNSVIKLLQAQKVELPAWVKLETKNKPPKKEPVAAPEAPAEPPAADEAKEEGESASEADAPKETPAEEAPAESEAQAEKS